MDDKLIDIRAAGAQQAIVVERPRLESIKNIKGFSEGMLPRLDVSKFTDDVNALIDRYNQYSDSEANKNNRIALLEQIQDKIKEINYKFPPDSIAGSNEYLKVCANLFNDIQKQYASMGKTMLKADNSNGSLAELIANMHPDFADSFSEKLVKSRAFRLNEEFDALCDKYSDNKETLASVLALKAFVKKNEISYLGGGNSRNFLVTKIDTQEKEVLKVDFRLDMPRNVEAYLRGKVVDGFTAISTERQVALTVRGELTGRTLLVTEYCSKGNLEDYSKNLDNIPPSQRMKNLGFIFQQMSSTMLKIQGAGCLFSDGKIGNWLVDDKNRLRIADTKSFVFVDAKGVYSPTLPGNEHCGFLTTKKFNPPEYTNKTRNADSTHAYLLGANLYVFVTGAQPPNKDNGQPYTYNQAVFQGSEGEHLKELISALVKNDPLARLSLKEAHHKLFLLATPEFRAVFSELKKLKICETDVLMDEFIREKQQLISNAPNAAERERIVTEIRSTITDLNANEAFKGVKNIITTLRTEAQKVYNYGKGAKAEKIERALVELPIVERIKLEKSTHVCAQKVMEGLASKRTIGGVKDVKLTDTQEIEFKNAAGTFKSFKDRFKMETTPPPVAAAKKETVSDAFNRPTQGM